MQHGVDLPLGVPGHLADGVELLLSLMAIEGELVSVMVEALDAL